jgi:hypothetical protein
VAAVSVACTSARSVPCASALSSPARLKVASPAPSPHRRGGVDYLAEGFLSFRAGSRELHERLSERCSTLFFSPSSPARLQHASPRIIAQSLRGHRSRLPGRESALLNVPQGSEAELTRRQ